MGVSCRSPSTASSSTPDRLPPTTTLASCPSVPAQRSVWHAPRVPYRCIEPIHHKDMVSVTIVQPGVHLPFPSGGWLAGTGPGLGSRDRKSTRLNSSHLVISYAVFCLKKK